MPDESLLARIERIEARQKIGELPTRYAKAIDGRDIDGWVNLFVEDVNCGRYGTGREALKSFIDPSVRTFYRSIHYICGHVVDFEDENNATGTVYCRAEHEVDDQWIVMGIIYVDRYTRRGNDWFFLKRSEKHWYSADHLVRPQPPFQLWDEWADRLPQLPGDFSTWNDFWSRSSAEDIAKITSQP